MLRGWKDNEDGTVTLEYSEGNVTVSKQDFNRAFGAIINATREEVIRDFVH